MPHLNVSDPFLFSHHHFLLAPTDSSNITHDAMETRTIKLPKTLTNMSWMMMPALLMSRNIFRLLGPQRHLDAHQQCQSLCPMLQLKLIDAHLSYLRPETRIRQMKYDSITDINHLMSMWCTNSYYIAIDLHRIVVS